MFEITGDPVPRGNDQNAALVTITNHPGASNYDANPDEPLSEHVHEQVSVLTTVMQSSFRALAALRPERRRRSLASHC